MHTHPYQSCASGPMRSIMEHHIAHPSPGFPDGRGGGSAAASVGGGTGGGLSHGHRWQPSETSITAVMCRATEYMKPYEMQHDVQFAHLKQEYFSLRYHLIRRCRNVDDRHGMYSPKLDHAELQAHAQDLCGRGR